VLTLSLPCLSLCCVLGLSLTPALQYFRLAHQTAAELLLLLLLLHVRTP
jgi:hypothetical protein